MQLREKEGPSWGLEFLFGQVICLRVIFVSPWANRVNTWVMHSSGFECTYITYPSLTNQHDTFLCWQTVPKQTQSVHLISGSVGCAWQALYILLNNTVQQFAALNVRMGSQSHKLSNDISFLWLFLGSGHSVQLNESCDSVVKQFL